MGNSQSEKSHTNRDGAEFTCSRPVARATGFTGAAGTTLSTPRRFEHRGLGRRARLWQRGGLDRAHRRARAERRGKVTNLELELFPSYRPVPNSSAGMQVNSAPSLLVWDFSLCELPTIVSVHAGA